MSMMNPIAGPSGPGKFSTRTDLPPSQEYGERKALQDIISSAPTPSAASQPQPRVVPLTAPTERPDVPLTSGMDIGDGPGSEILPNFRQSEADIVTKYMPALNAMASEPEAPQSFRLFVRYLQGNT